MPALYTPLHDQTVKFLATATGRDRINRFVQYFARFLVWHGQKNAWNKETVERLNKLMGSAAQTRKFMRIGRQVEFIRNVQKANLVKDDVTRATQIIKNTFMALWLVHDTLQWANTAGVARFENIKDISKRGLKCWLIALIASLLGDVHKLRLNTQRLEQETKLQRALKAKGDSDSSAVQTINALNAERSKIVWATVQDGLDMLLPASGLEYVKLESGIVGLVGAVTSVMGGVTQWNSL
ncbi:Peroxisomal membrane protein PMP27 [Gaertneriomyces sp. JEL0708]|nr:Peroxisomal membrane protein PMP27 [Gaertneriomyces sp. JEL0708]